MISASKRTRYSRSTKKTFRRYHGITFKSRIRRAFRLWIWRKTAILKYKKWFKQKTVRSSYGNIDLNIPRDRDGSFEPQELKKYEKYISNIENQIISMYGKGMTTRDISSYIKDIYGFGISETMV